MFDADDRSIRDVSKLPLRVVHVSGFVFVAVFNFCHDIFSYFQNIPDVFDSDGFGADLSTVAFNSSKIYKIYRGL